MSWMFDFTDDVPVITKAPRRKIERKSLKDMKAENIMKVVETFTTDQKKAFYSIVSEDGGNLFLTGSAGTGKSYCIKEAISYLRNVLLKQVVVCATTATAARILDAVTVHKFFGFMPDVLIDEDGKPIAKATAKICEADYIIIDEVSMMRVDCFRSVIASIKKANKKRAKVGKRPIRLICIGDFAQIPPVVTDKDRDILKERLGDDIGSGFAFTCDEWWEADFQYIELNEVMRQKGEDGFIKALNKIRIGDSSAVHWFNEHCEWDYNPDAVSLFPYNKMVKAENKKRLASLSSQEEVYTAELYGASVTEKEVEDSGLDYELKLKSGCRVMIKCNPYDGADWCRIAEEKPKDYINFFCNGSVGTYQGAYKDDSGKMWLLILLDTGVYVSISKRFFDIYDYREIDGKWKKIKTGDGFFQYPICLAYAMTFHKSQGASIDKINIYPKSFASGMLYVALSRVKGGAENIYLQDCVMPDAAMLSQEVVEFYEKMRGK